MSTGVGAVDVSFTAIVSALAFGRDPQTDKGALSSRADVVVGQQKLLDKSETVQPVYSSRV